MLAQSSHARRRERLVCRANSLQKAIRQIIEHSENRKISFCFCLSSVNKMMITVNEYTACGFTLMW